jgi:steroid delta-isomerase-like uncharacterized protein
VGGASMPQDSDPQIAARIALVDEHIRLENAHDLEGIMSTFGASARYDDEAWDGHYRGRDGVRSYYQTLLNAMPDLKIEVKRRFATDEAVIVEVIISGHHGGLWRGLPPTGRAVEFPLCGIFEFDGDNRLAGERIYYDRASVLRQLGIFHEPDSPIGRAEVTLMHPGTMAQIVGRWMSQLKINS